MVNKQQLVGDWNRVKGKVKQQWGQLTDDDLNEFEGDADELVGLIQRKTGDSRDRIEDYLENAINEGSGTVERASEQARQYMEQGTAAIEAQREQLMESARHGYEEATNAVRRNPIESVAVAFGAGIIAGVVVGLALRSR